MRFTITVLMLTLLFITGCSVREPVYVSTTKYEYIHIPDRLLVNDIKTPSPVDRNLFINSNPDQQIVYLINNIMALYGTIRIYKSKLKAIKTYNDNMSTTDHKKKR